MVFFRILFFLFNKTKYLSQINHIGGNSTFGINLLVPKLIGEGYRQK